MSVPFWEDLAAGWDGKVTESGRIRVPEGPGLGDELNLDVAREDEPRQWVRSRIRLAALSSPHEAHAGWEGHDDRALAAEHDAVHGSQEPDPSANALCQRAYREAGR